MNRALLLLFSAAVQFLDLGSWVSFTIDLVNPSISASSRHERTFLRGTLKLQKLSVFLLIPRSSTTARILGLTAETFKPSSCAFSELLL